MLSLLLAVNTQNCTEFRVRPSGACRALIRSGGCNESAATANSPLSPGGPEDRGPSPRPTTRSLRPHLTPGRRRRQQQQGGQQRSSAAQRPHAPGEQKPARPQRRPSNAESPRGGEKTAAAARFSSRGLGGQTRSGQKALNTASPSRAPPRWLAHRLAGAAPARVARGSAQALHPKDPGAPSA